MSSWEHDHIILKPQILIQWRLNRCINFILWFTAPTPDKGWKNNFLVLKVSNQIIMNLCTPGLHHRAFIIWVAHHLKWLSPIIFYYPSTKHWIAELRACKTFNKISLQRIFENPSHTFVITALRSFSYVIAVKGHVNQKNTFFWNLRKEISANLSL